MIELTTERFKKNITCSKQNTALILKYFYLVNFGSKYGVAPKIETHGVVLLILVCTTV